MFLNLVEEPTKMAYKQVYLSFTTLLMLNMGASFVLNHKIFFILKALEKNKAQQPCGSQTCLSSITQHYIESLLKNYSSHL